MNALKNTGIALLVAGSLSGCLSKQEKTDNAIARQYGLYVFSRAITTGTVIERSDYAQATDSFALRVRTDDDRYTISVLPCVHEGFPRPDALWMHMKEGARVVFPRERARTLFGNASYFNTLKMGTLSSCDIAPLQDSSED